MAMKVARSMWWRPANWEQSRLRPISSTVDSETPLAATPKGARQRSPGMATCPRVPGGSVLPSSVAFAASLTTLGLSTASTSSNSRCTRVTPEYTVDVAVDGDLVTTWTSSETTSGFESVDMSGATGQVVTVIGAGLSESEWLSIVETEIMVYNGVAPPPSPTTPATPSPTLPPSTDLNACFDRTSDDYRCLPSEEDPTLCESDWCTQPSHCKYDADIPACLETFGKADIQFVYMPFHDHLTTLPVGVF
ncbi:unnamed protein product [Ectocarpus sp. 12 AP-2014]